MATTDKASFWDFKGIEEYNDSKFLIHSPYPLVLILISYLWFVLKIGPEYMKNRPPFSLRYWLVAYNASQVAIALHSFILGAQTIAHYGLWQSRCVVDEDPEKRILLVDGSHFYFMTKVMELLDTVFFVLRKKQRQVSFLHVYHHTIMVIATYSITKYSKTDATIFLGTLNSFVHVIMYSYYALSAFPQLVKYLWWKKYITMLQLIQFSLMFVHVVVSHYVSKCSPAYYLVSSVCVNTVFFLYLFGDFYIKSYKKSSTSKDTVTVTKQAKINESTNSKNTLNYIISSHKFAGKIH